MYEFVNISITNQTLDGLDFLSACLKRLPMSFSSTYPYICQLPPRSYICTLELTRVYLLARVHFFIYIYQEDFFLQTLVHIYKAMYPLASWSYGDV